MSRFPLSRPLDGHGASQDSRFQGNVFGFTPTIASSPNAAFDSQSQSLPHYASQGLRGAFNSDSPTLNHGTAIDRRLCRDVTVLPASQHLPSVKQMTRARNRQLDSLPWPVHDAMTMEQPEKDLSHGRDANDGYYQGHVAGSQTQNSFEGMKPRQTTSIDNTSSPFDSRSRYHRRQSASSHFSANDDSFWFSEPSSDITSNQSGMFGCQSIPLYPQPYALKDTDIPSDKMYPNDGAFAAHNGKIPEFLLDEIKTLKLENMALRQLASEVIRVEHAKETYKDGISDQTKSSCSYHPALGSSPILNHVRRSSVISGQTSPSSAAVDFVLRTAPLSSLPSLPQQPTAQPGRVLQRPQKGDFSGGSFSEHAKRASGANTRAKSPIARGIRSQHYSSSPQDYFSIVKPPLEESRLLDTAFASTSSVPVELLTATLPAQLDEVPSSTHRLEDMPASMLIGMILEKRGQEASILLQSQAQTASQQRKDEIHEVATYHLLPLCHDRHGNFLVQRLIETRPDMTRCLLGAFVELATSQFGCHVVQKVSRVTMPVKAVCSMFCLDAAIRQVLEGDQDVRKKVTEELLQSRLEETMTSRNSIHVWQQILETDWTDQKFRQHISSTINEQLRGKWVLIARQETGSIICQNLFESAKDRSDSQECLQEVLAHVEECATNQWGIWVVQHIIEHGNNKERASALTSLLRSATTITLSTYGQKAIMSALKTTSTNSAAESSPIISKTGPASFTERYVNIICQASMKSEGATRRPELVDVCLSPHGIQIMTQLLTTVEPHLRDKLISTVRRNSVFLKGNKTGTKVHQLCERARAFSGY